MLAMLQVHTTCRFPASILNGDEGHYDSCVGVRQPLFSMQIPPGATSISFDAVHYRFVVSFNGVADGA